ncbi:hypothetical protein [Klugiella xanthotipulae]|nr:hypothetical protein [Klugiella xanthotipulae]
MSEPLYLPLWLGTLFFLSLSVPVQMVYSRALSAAWLREAVGGSIDRILDTVDREFLLTLAGPARPSQPSIRFLNRQYPFMGGSLAGRVLEQATPYPDGTPSAAITPNPPLATDYGLMTRLAQRMDARARVWMLVLLWAVPAVLAAVVFLVVAGRVIPTDSLPPMVSFVTRGLIGAVLCAAILSCCILAFLWSRHELRRDWLGVHYGGSVGAFVGRLDPVRQDAILAAWRKKGLPAAYAFLRREYPGLTAFEQAAVIRVLSSRFDAASATAGAGPRY